MNVACAVNKGTYLAEYEFVLPDLSIIDLVPKGLVRVTSICLRKVKFKFKTNKTCSRYRILTHAAVCDTSILLFIVATPSIL